MATFWEIAAHSVSNLLFISRFGIKSGICLLIVPVPVHCFSLTFIWKLPTDKIKREVNIQDFIQGELRMIHLKKYIYALKLGWIRRLIINESKYKILIQSTYEKYRIYLKKGDTYIEEMMNNCSNKFWYDVLDVWYIFIRFLKPRTKEDIMGISLWKKAILKLIIILYFIEDGTKKTHYIY